MTDSTVYAQVADALDRLPNGFPRTESGVELELLAHIYTPEQAAMAALLTREMEPSDDIAARAGLTPREARHLLIQMARQGQVWLEKRGRTLRARLAPFVVGVYEAQVHKLDHEMADLVERYFREGGTKGIMGPEPALHRVVPAMSSIHAETILPYDDVRAILMEAKSFHVQDCICRKEQELIGERKCDFELENCLSFSSQERALGPGDLTREQALKLLADTEEAGLVHSVSNVQQGHGYVCNCCGCCCGILRGITEYGIETSMAKANYYAVIDEEACIGCGICADRCQVGAITLPKDVAVVDLPKCIGCGLCVTGCPQDAVSLVRKPESERITPPSDYGTWEEARLQNRGMA